MCWHAPTTGAPSPCCLKTYCWWIDEPNSLIVEIKMKEKRLLRWVCWLRWVCCEWDTRESKLEDGPSYYEYSSLARHTSTSSDHLSKPSPMLVPGELKPRALKIVALWYIRLGIWGRDCNTIKMKYRQRILYSIAGNILLWSCRVDGLSVPPAYWCFASRTIGLFLESQMINAK